MQLCGTVAEYEDVNTFADDDDRWLAAQRKREGANLEGDSFQHAGAKSMGLVQWCVAGRGTARSEVRVPAGMHQLGGNHRGSNLDWHLGKLCFEVGTKLLSIPIELENNSKWIWQTRKCFTCFTNW